MPTIRKHIHINAPIDKVYSFLENFENYPSMMEHIESAKKLGNNQYMLTVKTPINTKLEFKTQILEKKLNESMKWTSEHETGKATTDAKGSGELHLKKGDHGTSTDLDLEVNYEVSSELEKKMKEFEKIIGSPSERVDRHLQKIKDRLEHEAR